VRVAWVVAFLAGCASAFLWLSLGMFGLPVTAILVALTVRLNQALGTAGLLTGAGSFVVATTALSLARCDAFNSSTSGCTSFGATEFLVLGVALMAIGVGVTIGSALLRPTTNRS
jgi:uncharacterized membrane protein YkgB